MDRLDKRHLLGHAPEAASIHLWLLVRHAPVLQGLALSTYMPAMVRRDVESVTA